MVGLSAFQSGPKGSETLNLDVFDNFGPFWVNLDTFGPFQTKINLLPHKDKAGFDRGAFEQKIIFSWFKTAFSFWYWQYCLLTRHIPSRKRLLPNYLGIWLSFKTIILKVLVVKMWWHFYNNSFPKNEMWIWSPQKNISKGTTDQRADVAFAKIIAKTATTTNL